MSVDIRVNAESIDRYGDTATECFAGVQSALQALVDAVANVNYQGENAVAFKKQAGALSVAFAEGIHKDMVAMTGSVNAATTAVSNSLGGRNVSVTVAAKSVTPNEGVQADAGVVQVNTAALSGLKSDVEAQFKAVTSQLTTHQGALTSTDWTGAAKDRAVGEVGKLTTNSMEQCETAQKSLNEFITTQVDNTMRSDV